MRQFLAAGFPARVREELAAIRADLEQRILGWRWVREESVHLTLRFLGEVVPDHARLAGEAWRQAAARSQPFRIRLSGVGRFPERGRPRVLWVGLEEIEPGGVLERLAADVESEARRLGWPAQPRAFRPHLTLARSRPDGRADAPPERVAERSRPVWIRELVLYRSELLPGGARYTALANFPLGPSSDEPTEGSRG